MTKLIARLELTMAVVMLAAMAIGSTPKAADGAPAAKARNPKAQAASIAGARAETYKTIGEVELKLHVFEPEDHKASDKRPAVVFFFGGGWTGGTVNQFVPQAKYLASRGMVAMVADYRVSSRHKTTPFECVKDGKSAVRWIRANAARLGVDPNRIAAGGGSAGGHVAAATGTVPGLEEEGEDLSISSRPDALLLFNPVYDNGPEGYGHGRVKDRYKEISPMHNISDKTPPTIVHLGSKDNLIPVATAERYEELMKKAGVRCDTHIYEGAGHGFFNHGRKGGYYEKTMLATDEFLQSIGYLEGQATIEKPK